MHFFLKICSRGITYFRGIRTCLYIILCGGKCRGIPRIGKGVIWKYPPHKGIRFGKNIDIGAYCFFDCPKGSTMVFEDNIKLTYNITIAAANKIIIGKNTLIAEYTSIRDSTHGIFLNKLICEQKCILGKIIIGSDVWIGRNNLILGNVQIATGVVLGANSFANKNLDISYGIYWGEPALLKKKRL